MTNGRSTGGIWLRDWSSVASRRMARWTSRVPRRLVSGIARKAPRPTLKLFGAARRPGPAMATVIPRQEPLVLRVKRPARRIDAPMLTVQSETEFDLRETPEPVLDSPAEPQAPATVVRRSAPLEPDASASAEPAGSLARPQAHEPANRPGPFTRILRQVLRRPAPPPAQTREESREPDSDARARSRAASVQPAAPAQRTEVTSQAEPASISPASPSAPMSIAETAGAPVSPEATDTAPDRNEATSSSELAEPPVARKPAAEDSSSGLLMSLRRVFRAQAPGTEATRPGPVPQPGTGDVAPVPAASPAAAPAGEAQVSRASSAPASESRAEAPLARSVTTPSAQPPQPRSPSPKAAHPLSRTTPVSEDHALAEPARQSMEAGQAPPRPERGLMMALRRLIRPEATPEPQPRTEPSEARPASTASASPRPPTRSVEPAAALSRHEAPQMVPPAEGLLADVEDEGVEHGPRPPAQSQLEQPPLTLLHRHSVPQEPEDSLPEPSAAQGVMESAVEDGDAADALYESPAPQSAVSVSRLPRILRFLRREPAVRPASPDVTMTLARQAAPAPARQARGAELRGETGLARAEMPALESAPAALPSAGDAGFSLQSRSRQTSRPAPSIPVARSDAPLVYRARSSREAAPEPGMVPGAMTTLSVPPDVIARARGMSLLNGLGGDASERLSNLAGAAEASITGAMGGGLDVSGRASVSGAGEASAGAAAAVTPGSAGPAAAAQQLEADAGKQITLETLARQVYDRIRSRLIVERERGGLGSPSIGR